MSQKSIFDKLDDYVINSIICCQNVEYNEKNDSCITVEATELLARRIKKDGVCEYGEISKISFYIFL